MRNSQEIIQLVQEIRKNKKMSMDELSEKVGVSKSTISRYESGQRQFPINDLGKYAMALNTTAEYLLGTTENAVYDYPFYPAQVAAGLPENVSSITNDDVKRIELPDSVMGKWSGQNDIFLLKVNGESMNKTIPNKSLIAVKPIDIVNLNNGDIVVYSDGNDYSVKRFYQSDNKLIFRPDSTDMSFTDYISSTDNNGLRIHGKVVVYIVELD